MLLYTAFLSESDGHPLKADVLKLCGDEFFKVFHITGDDQDFRRAITAYEQAAACLPSGDPRLPGFINNIGTGYLACYGRLGRLDDLQTAITTMKNGIAVTTDEHADMLPGQFNNLGTATLRRFERTGDLDDLSEAIRNHENAVQLTPDEHPALPSRVSNLGTGYLRRFESTGNPDDLSGAIQNQQRAVQLTPDGSPDLPTWLNNLGRSFLRRFERTGDLHDISEAVHQESCAPLKLSEADLISLNTSEVTEVP